MRLVFLGPPGSGKGTQARLLHERLGVAVIGTGDILRDAVRRKTPLGQQVEAFLVSGRLVPDDLVNAIVADLFRGDGHPTRFVMDGYPRTLPQAVSFESVLHDAGQDLEHVVLFRVPTEELIRRLSGRRLTECRRDDAAETVKKRLDVYHASTEPLVDHFRGEGLLREVDATADVEAVYQAVVRACGG
ncbi:MAG TPA: adenylate kinase [Gemmataceae bacterium]|jgi:adenylate kinase